MIRTEALTRLRLLVGASRPPLVATSRDRELPPLQPGQAVQARVEQQSQAGHLVSVSGRVFEFRLPEGTHPGDFLRLVYIHSEPRPTFALLRIERAVDSPDARLSDAGKLLSSLRALTDSQGEAPANRTQVAVAVLPSDLPDVPQAAVMLRDAFSLSGLFYESHQAQWVMGSRSVAQLEEEPQGKLPPLPPRTETTPRPQGFGLSDAPDLFQVQPEPAALVAPTAAEAAQGTEADGGLHRLPAHPDSFPYIRQQLAALETGVVAWRGEVWPGQDMEWEIGEAPDPDHPETQQVWRTELRLTLPRLGEVRARIEFAQPGLRLQVLADSESHRAELLAAGDALASAFAARNLPLAAFEVRVHDA